MRLVAYIQADLDSSEAVDPLLPEVAWSWLVDALEARGRAGHRAGRHRHRHHVGALRRHLRAAAGPPAGAARLVDRDDRWSSARMCRRSARCSSTPRACRRPGSPIWGRVPAPELTDPDEEPDSAAAGTSRKNPRPRRCWRPPTGVPELSVTPTRNRLCRRTSGVRARPVRGRRGTGVGFPLLQPGLSGADPPRGRGHGADRPGQPRRRPGHHAARRSPRCWRTDEWVLHAADQDLPCLAELGMRRPRLYDTELAGRLAGFERVNLAAMVRRLLGPGTDEGARRRRLVEAAAARRRGSTTPRWTSRCCSNCATRSPRVLAEQGKTDVGGAGVRVSAHRRARRPRDATGGGARRASTRCAIRGRWPPCASCGPPATRSPGAATSHRAGSCPTPRSSTPPPPTQDRRRTHRAAGVRRTQQRRSAQVWLEALARARDDPEPPEAPGAAQRPAAGVALEPPQTRGGRAAGGGARPRSPNCRNGSGADREPGHPRAGAPAVLGLAADRRRRGGDRCVPARGAARGRGSASWWSPCSQRRWTPHRRTTNSDPVRARPPAAGTPPGRP